MVTSRRLLVVDDSSSIRKIIKVFLSASPYEVIEADGAARALQVLRLMKVDAVIADLNMPEMDGLTFVRQVRASDVPHVRGLPIVVLTGEQGSAIEQKGLEAGADVFVRKPISGPALLAAVTRAVGGRS